jgi:excisionase family DNA binding protein
MHKSANVHSIGASSHIQDIGGSEKMNKGHPDELMTPSDAARILGLSADSVRALSDAGRLPTLRTVSGRRLFRRGDVEKLASDRARKKR